jgi:hypothetical protein
MADEFAKPPFKNATTRVGNFKVSNNTNRSLAMRRLTRDEKLVLVEAERIKVKYQSEIQEARRVPLRSDSYHILKLADQKFGRGTIEYYQHVKGLVERNAIAPYVVVGGGYKNARKVALSWLQENIDRLLAEGAEPPSEFDSEFYEEELDDPLDDFNYVGSRHHY